MLLRPLKGLITALFLPLLALAVYAQTPDIDSSQGLQMEFPTGGQLRIENDLGKVMAESWHQKYIYVTASGETGRSRLSSVVIENGKQGFTIRVKRRPGAQVSPIDLSVKFPESARVEIETGNGGIFLRGVSSAVIVKSLGGDLNVELPESANANIVARTTKGSVKSELSQALSENGHLLQTRLGDGARTLRLNSDSGNITFSVVGTRELGSEPEIRKSLEPALSEVPTKAAGTPAPSLDTQDVDEGDVVRVDSQLATLNLSVIDRETNRGVVGLTQSDFRLFENGVPQQILQFDSSSAPFDLLLVIDLSGSTRDVLKLIRAAALRFVDAARPSDRIGVITFAGQATRCLSLDA